MEEEGLVRGIIYSEVDDALGPNPVMWLPQNIPEDMKMHVSIKTTTLLTADRGIVPDSLVILPFPLLNLKGIIKYIEMKDATKRGGIYITMITLLFHELNDVIFYKGMEHFESVFNAFAQRIIKLKEYGAGRENVLAEIEQLRTNILDVLEDLKEKEQQGAFPEKEIQPVGRVDYQFKVIVVGDPQSGKTSLILRFTENAFRRTYISTLGVQVSNKLIRLKDNTIIQLVMWDIAGQQKFDLMRTAFYQGAKGVLLVFDLTNPTSFQNLVSWYDDIKKFLDFKRKLVGFVLGNKSDLLSKRAVSWLEASQIAGNLSLEYFETSAKTGVNVDNSFYKIADYLHKLNQ